MTTPPIASEAAASSCPDWMTDDYLRRQLLDLHAGPIAAEVLRLRKENETLRDQEKNADSVIAHIRRCMTSIDGDGSLCDLSSRVGAATAELVSLRKESKRQRAEKAEALLAEVARILGGAGDVVQRARTVTSKLRTAEADREEMLQNLAGISTIACAESLEHYRPGCSWERAALGDVVKLVRKLQEARAEVVIERSARENAETQVRPAKEALVAAHDELNSVARVLGWTGKATLADRAKIVVKERDKAWSDLAKARAERNEFAARQVEGFLDWARKPGSPWSGELRDAARARAAQLRLGDVRDAIAAMDLQFAADVKQALGVELVAAPTEERVLFACSKCSPQNAKSIEDQINRVVSKRVEAERAKPLTGSCCGTGQQEMPPMRRDASGRVTLATPVRTPQIPSTDSLADIAYCRRDPTLQESRHMAGELLDRRTGRTPQRFSLGTKFHDALRRACGRGSGFQSGPIGFAALTEAVEALGAAVEAELSGRS